MDQHSTQQEEASSPGSGEREKRVDGRGRAERTREACILRSDRQTVCVSSILPRFLTHDVFVQKYILRVYCLSNSRYDFVICIFIILYRRFYTLTSVL